jgi:hypothetical protein
MNLDAVPDADKPAKDTSDNSPEPEAVDRRAILTVAKYSAPLIAALLPDKAKAFSF